MTNPADSHPHPPPDSPATHYIDAGAFDAILARWLSLPLINRARLTNTITADYFYPLARNVISGFDRDVITGRAGHVDPADLAQECVMSCIQKMRFYNPARATAFNFFTTVCINKITSYYAREWLPKRSVNHRASELNEVTTKHIAVRSHFEFQHKIRSITETISRIKGLKTC